MRLLCCLQVVYDQEYNFFVVQELQRTPNYDFVLNLPSYQYIDGWFIIGPQSVTSSPSFFIDLSCPSGVSGVSGVSNSLNNVSSSLLVHCTWNVDYM